MDFLPKIYLVREYFAQKKLHLGLRLTGIRNALPSESLSEREVKKYIKGYGTVQL